MSALFSSQTPIQKSASYKRKALQEQSAFQTNARPHDPGRPTVRIVSQADTLSSASRSGDEFLAKARGGARLPSQYLKLPKEASATSVTKSRSLQPGDVSDVPTPANQDGDKLVPQHKLHLPPTTILLPKSSVHPVPKTAWHRRTGSGDTYLSDTETLAGSSPQSASYAYPQASSRRDRFSQGTTLRGTPTPDESEHPQQPGQQEDDDREEPWEHRRGVVQALETLQEASPERSTVRVVPSLLKSRPSDSSHARSQTASSSSSDADKPTSPRLAHTRTRSSVSPVPRPLHIEKRAHAPRNQPSQASIAQSEATIPPSSSPNIVAYHPTDAHRRSQSSPLHYATSTESIQSRLQYPFVIRPITGRSIVTKSSWASLESSSSTDTLPPLILLKKRLRHKHSALSLSELAHSGTQAGSSRMELEEVDTEPYPHDAFGSHLSTIASESDRQSRSLSQQLSHFSLGSGVLTGDDSSSIPMSSTWPRKRPDAPPRSPSVGSRALGEDEPGDMTLGLFRAESAKPEPLAVGAGKAETGSGSRHYDGPLPPVPPIPKTGDSGGEVDTVPELTAPPLRQKRSGYTLRQRSNSTPGQSHSRHDSQISYSESERWSHGTNIFPTWARHFYSGTAALVFPSRVSLNSTSTPQQQRRLGHGRNDSQWTERSITSRLGTRYSTLDGTGSPTSSHFLPSIFRLRTRRRARSEEASRSSRHRRSGRSWLSADRDSRPDSLAILNDPLPESLTGQTTPSGQPKWGQLREGEPPLPPLPRKYSKQKQWDQMEFPRRMSKDRPSDFNTWHHPHLTPTKRNSTRLSVWRAPSFVESLDTLIRSRCNRQILLFALGFLCPLLWWLAAILPLPAKSLGAMDVEKATLANASEDDIQAAMANHEAGDAERRFREERQWLKARWWRYLNRIMSVIGMAVVAAVIALAVIATRN